MSGFDFSSAQVAALAVYLFGKPNRLLSTSHELRFGRNGSLSVVPERGIFSDFEYAAAGGLLDMVIHGGVARSRFEAIAWLKHHGHVLERAQIEWSNPKRVQKERANKQEREVVACSLWDQRQPLLGSPAEAYLRQVRAIDAPLDEADLGYLSNAPVHPLSKDSHHRPALIAAVRNAEGAVTGCHLTYLRPDGMGKAALKSSRKMVGSVGGCHVPLIASTSLVVAEGIESALSAYDVLKAHQPDNHSFGACAALSAAGLEGFKWPDDTRELIIAPDNDESGMGKRAALKLAQKASVNGLRVHWLSVPEGFSDWNDWKREGGHA